MNTEIYETGNIVDGLVSGALIFSTYKIARQIYYLAMSTGTFSITASAFWAVMIFTQVGYLNSTYLRQVYLIQEMELLENL